MADGLKDQSRGKNRESLVAMLSKTELKGYA